MELLKRFAAGLVVGAALVAVGLFGLALAGAPGRDSTAGPPAESVPLVPPPVVVPEFEPAPRVGPPVVPPLPPEVKPFRVKDVPPPELGPLPDRMPDMRVPVERPPLGRTAVRFAGPDGLKVSWLVAGGFHDRELTAPAAFNFGQASLYRLRLSGMAKFPQARFYPTLEVAPPAAPAVAFLAHSAVPARFTDAELAAAAEGHMVVKAVYLPHATEGTPAARVEEVSSLGGHGGDPVRAAAQRGTLLLVIRLGNVDLENANSPALNDPPAPK